MYATLFNAKGYEKVHRLVSQGFRHADLSIGMAQHLGSAEKVTFSDIAGRIDDKKLPKNVFEHIELLPIEIAYAQNPNMDLAKIWKDMESQLTV
jgi:hypothetical protein